MRLFGSGVAALVILTLTGCGLQASPADALQFHPPPGWQSSPGILGFMQFWRPPVDDREVLMLFKSPKPLQPSEVFSNARMSDTLKDATIDRRESIVICGHQPATYFQLHGTSSRGDSRAEMVMTNISGAGYFALYARPLVVPPNPAAQAALRELCAKP
jgi:hypothetical protein